jgi:hypothetical protein
MSSTSVEQGSRPKYPVCNTYIPIGWLMIVTVTFVQRPLFTFLPPLFASEGVSSLWASLPLFLHMAVSAVFGLALFRFRDTLYRRTPFLLIQGGGGAALCAMWVWPTYWVCFSMLCVLGVYAGFVYYCAVYYASNSGRRSFNTGVNEALVGVGSEQERDAALPGESQHAEGRIAFPHRFPAAAGVQFKR